MYVCFFNRSYWPDQAATGQLLTELAEDLVARHQCQVSIVTGPALHAADREAAAAAAPSGPADSREARPASASASAAGRSACGGFLARRLVRREVHAGVTIFRTTGTRVSPRRFAGRAANYLTYFAGAACAASVVGRPDVVVSLTDPPIIGLVAIQTARRVGARYVHLSEDIFPEVAALLEDFHSRTVNLVLDRINRYLLRSAGAIVALGPRMRRRLIEEKGANASRIAVIHNWADCEALVPGPRDNPFARAHGLVDRFVLIHSGNVGLSQDLHVLVEAASRLTSKERLLVLIIGNGTRREALEQDVARRGLTNVRFLPYQPKALLHESFASADAFLVALKAGIEGYIVPSKLYGILAAGRPYIAAVDPSSEPAIIAADYGCGLLAAPGDPHALAGAIARLYEDPALLRTMGQRARAAALQFDRRVAVRAYYDLLAREAGLARAA